MHVRQSEFGAGLALSVLKSFVELHGRDLHLISEPDSGTAIVFHMPAPLRLHRLDVRADNIEAAS